MMYNMKIISTFIGATQALNNGLRPDDSALIQMEENESGGALEESQDHDSISTSQPFVEILEGERSYSYIDAELDKLKTSIMPDVQKGDSADIKVVQWNVLGQGLGPYEFQLHNHAKTYPQQFIENFEDHQIR